MKKWVVQLVIVVVLCSQPVWAENIKSPEETTPVLDTMVVTAGRVKEKKEDVTTNITVVTEEQIKQSSAQDLGDLLAEQGLMVIEYPNSLISVGIRGFRTQTQGNDLTGHLLVLINGRRAGTGNLSKIQVDNVERIEIIRGPGSVQYGSSAMGGIINVITKQGHGKPSVFAEGTLGSWNYQKASAGASGQFNNFDFSFTASSESQDDYSTSDGDTYYNTGFDSKERISVNAGWTFMPENRIGITYTGYDAEDIGSPSYLSQNDLDDYVDNSIKTVDVIYDGQAANGFLLWNLRYFNGKDEQFNYNPSIIGGKLTYSRDTDQQGAQAQLTFKWDHAHLTAGLDWAKYEISDIYTSGDNTYDNPAVFIMAKTKLLDDRLVLSLGGRYDWYDVESDDGRSTDETNWSNSVGAAYKIMPGLSIRANYAEAFRMPSADELYMFADYSAWGFGVWSGNPDLNPEKSKTYEAGIDFSKGTFSGGLTCFYTDFEDKISYSYDTAANLTRYNNIDGATISGIEGMLNFDIGAIYDWDYELAPYASFTYLIEYENEETNEYLQYNPQWSASYGIKFANPDIGLITRLNFAYIGKQDITDYEGTGKTSLDGYMVADLTISKKLLSFDKCGNISIKADIRNIFNEEYATVQGYPMPGRSFYFGLKYSY